MPAERMPETELSQEAERLALLPREKQIAHVERLRGMTVDPRIRKVDRERLARKADGLERLLNLPPTELGPDHRGRARRAPTKARRPRKHTRG